MKCYIMYVDIIQTKENMDRKESYGNKNRDIYSRHLKYGKKKKSNNLYLIIVLME